MYIQVQDTVLIVKPRIAKSFDSYLVMLLVLMFRIFNIALLEPKIKSFEISTPKFSLVYVKEIVHITFTDIHWLKGHY